MGELHNTKNNYFMGALQVEPGDNNKYTMIGLRIFNLPKVDLNDPVAVKERLATYFQIYADADTKPTVNGMANALGISRQALWAIRSGNFSTMTGYHKLPAESVDYIKKAYAILEENWENYMENGKVNPVAGIFLGKNHFAYKDQTEYVVTPNTQQTVEVSEAELRKRYLTDGDSNDSEK